MAALKDGYILTTLAQKSSLLSIDCAQSSNFILITSQTSFINIFNVNDQKIFNSWSVRHGISITSPTTWSSLHNQYLTVFNKQEIRRWSEEEKSIDKAKKKHVKKDIKKILTYKDYEPIVVCENGTVDFIDGIKTTSEQPILDDDAKLVFCQLVPSPSGVKVLYISEVKSTRSLHCHEYNDSNKGWNHTTYSINYKDNILDYSYYTDNNNNTFIYYIGLDKDLYRIKVNNDSIEEELVTTITEITSSINMVALDSTQLIIAGLHHNNQDGFGIYDMKYSAIQSFQPFPEEYNIQPKIFLVENQLFLSCNRNIYVYDINSRTPTLGEFLGKSMTTDQEDTSQQVISWSVKDDKIKTNKCDDLEKLIDFSKTPNHSKFSSIFQSFLQKQDNLISISNIHLKKLCQRCLREKKFWPSEEMKELLEHGLIPPEISTELITVLIEKDEKKLLNLCLDKLTGISEQSLIQVLQYYLSLSEDDLNEEMILKSIPVLKIDEEKCPFSKLKTYLMYPYEK
ncbi:hypothetical protein LOTGIDRAFT_155456 [Lottia gigantea]|uniref:Nucleolar protein 11 N-terminal domain-containing protein n=1 Tax=Lottia gigantea TaxID=225164 RepID=V3ZTA4_LOTGI|nr:hypothetical protein LOTGIDRAFT_155456 [Lottia gigantea]ESO84131.1 hypothetical protein LOTGIDRAFT_155456 [Lottia gigantea]